MKIFEGKVTSISMNNTVVVEVVRRTPHPLYGKLIRRSKKYKVDSNGMQVEVGKRVKIVETKPMSKSKFFKLMEVIGTKNTKVSKKMEVEKVVAESVKAEKKIVKKGKK